LGALVDHSLIRLAAEEDAARYEMLETIREFGLEQLAAAGETASTRSRHGWWCLELAEAAEPAIAGPNQAGELARLDAEADNLRAALDWFVAAGDAAAAVRLTVALWRPWEIRGRPREMHDWLERALATAGAVPPELRARALNNLGNVLLDLDDPAAAGRYEQSLAIRREIGDRAGIADTLNNLGLLALARGRFAEAEQRLEESLSLRREQGDRAGEALALSNLGDVASAAGDFGRGWDLHERALAIRHGLGQPRMIGYSEHNLGEAAIGRGDLAVAAELFDRALGRFEAIGDWVGATLVHHQRGLLALRAGDLPRAAAELAEALPRRWEIGDRRGAAATLAGLAATAAASGNGERAGRLLGAAESLWEATGPPTSVIERQGRERVLAAVHGLPAVEAARRAGRVLPIEEAIVESARLTAALRESAQSGEPRTAAIPGPTGLEAGVAFTPRELEVLRQLADGRSDREIGDALYISHRTVATHVASILGKLGISSRTAAAAFAIRHGLG
jgi:DNA-binding CsgD family transcriptional regulator